MEKDQDLRQLYFRLLETEAQVKFLQRQLQEKELRIQLYQFAFDKIENLKHNLDKYKGLAEVWVEFEILYKITTGTNLIRFTDLDSQHKKFLEMINALIKNNTK